MNAEAKPRITVRHALLATADVTGSPVRHLARRALFEPVQTHRLCLYAAAQRVGLTAASIGRALGRGVSTVRRPRPEFEAAHDATISAIIARAAELAEAGPATVRDDSQRVPATAVVVAAARVAGGSVRDIVDRTRHEPWETYRRCAVAAARQLGIGPAQLASALGRRPNSVSGRAGSVARAAEQHGDVVERIKAMACDLAALPVDRIEALGRAAVAVPGASGAV